MRVSQRAGRYTGFLSGNHPEPAFSVDPVLPPHGSADLAGCLDVGRFILIGGSIRSRRSAAAWTASMGASAFRAAAGSGKYLIKTVAFAMGALALAGCTTTTSPVCLGLTRMTPTTDTARFVASSDPAFGRQVASNNRTIAAECR